MATYYIDLENGNDANAGTSFALAWKTVNTGATAARIAAGDTIRISSTPHTSLGNATWTDESTSVVLASSKTQAIAGSSETWTASANVVFSSSTTRKYSSNSASFAIAGAFTTGKVAYYATGTLDLSGYQQISFWWRASTGSVPANRFEVRLCSDTIGNVAVDTFQVPATGTASSWQTMTIDKGSNLGSSIQSIAIYAATDPGATTIYINNIIAVKAASSADSLSLTSLIGKGDSARWYPIRSINGTTVELSCGGGDGGDFVGTTFSSAYAETSETVTTYKLEPFQTTALLTSGSLNQVKDSGTVSSYITYSGGWGTAGSMATQDGYTAFSGQNSSSNGRVWDLNNQDYIKFERIIGTRCGPTFWDTSANNESLYFTDCFASGTNGALIDIVSVNQIYILRGGSHGSNNLVVGSGRCEIVGKDFRCGANGIVGGSFFSGFTPGSCAICDGLTAIGVTSIIGFEHSKPNLIRNVDARTDLLVANTTTSYTLAHNIRTSSLSDVGGGDVERSQGGVYASNVNTDGTLGHFVRVDGGKITTQSSVRHTNQGLAWQVSPTQKTYRDSFRPVVLKLAAQVYKAGVTAFVSAWVRRTSTDIQASLVMPMGEIIGLSADVSSTCTASINTWQQLTISFTPTITTVASPEFQVYTTNSNLQSAYIDDISFA